MALTSRAKKLISALGSVVLVGGAVVGYLIFTGKSESLPFVGGARVEKCPLTDHDPEGGVPNRAALAVKVENLSVARPQAGLAGADVIYEEPVEGGITRFVAIFQCNNAGRVGPVRSGRLVDPDILVQYGEPLFAYSGAASQVINAIGRTGVIQDLGFDEASGLYEEDPNRAAPHHLFVSTKEVYREGRKGTVPEPVFEFSEEEPGKPGSKKAKVVHLNFSPDADVFWEYKRKAEVWERSHGTTPHTLEDGSRVEAANIIVQIVKLEDSGIIDAAGNPSPEVDSIGSGKAFVFRNGRVISGRWERRSKDEVTQYVTKDGDVIPLAPGVTWVELFPSDLDVEFD